MRSEGLVKPKITKGAAAGNLRSLILEKSDVSDAAITTMLSGLSQLHSLRITYRKVIDECLSLLPCREKLQRLELPGYGASNNQRNHAVINSCAYPLYRLQAASTSSSASCKTTSNVIMIATIYPLPFCRPLCIHEPGGVLSQLTAVTYLDLSRSSCRGDFLKACTRLQRLVHFDLSKCPSLIDSNLGHVSTLKALQHLSLAETQV